MADFDLNRAVGLRPANNLSDVENPTEARTNIGAVGGGSVVPDSDGWHVTEGTVTPRTLTVTSTNITLNQDLQIVSTPQFAKIGIGQAAGTKEVLITGDVGITSTNQNMLTLDATGGADAGIAISSTNASNASRLKSVHDGSDDDFIIAVGGTDRANFTHEGFLFLGGATAQVSSEFIALTTPSDSYGFMQSDGTTSVGTFVNAAAGWYGTFSSTPLHFFVNNSAVALLLDSSGNTHVTTTNTLFLDDITAGSVLFAGTSGVVSENNTQFFWDDTNELLQIGSSSGTSPEVIINTTNNSGIAGIRLIEGNVNAGFELFYDATTNTFNILSDNGGGQRNTRLSIVRDTALVTIGGDLTLTAGDVNLTAGTVNLSTFTAGSVLFTAASGVVTEDNATFFWDDTDKRLGIGTASPTTILDVEDSSSLLLAQFTNTNLAGRSLLTLIAESGASDVSINLRVHGPDYSETIFGASMADSVVVTGSPRANIMGVGTRTAFPLIFGTTDLERMRIAAAGDVTINTGDLILTAGDLTLTAGTVNLSTFTAGSVLFTAASGVVTEDNANLFWDDSNNRLGIGTAAPASDVVVSRSSTTAVELVVDNSNAGTSASAVIYATNNGGFSGALRLLATGTNFTPIEGFLQDAGVLSAESDLSGGLSIKARNASADIRFYAGGNATPDMTLSAASDLTLSLGDLTLTAGDAIVTAGDVTITAGTVNLSAFTAGSVLFAGVSGVVSEDNATLFWDGTNKRLGIGNAAPAHALQIEGTDAQLVRIKNTADFARMVLEGNAAGNSGDIIFADSVADQFGIAWVTDRLAFLENDTTEVVTILDGGTVGIGTILPAGQLHVDQASTSGAVPVLVLDQGDIDDTFVNYIGTSAADSTRSISSSTAEAAAKFGAFRVEINGTTKWVRVYDSAV